MFDLNKALAGAEVRTTHDNYRVKIISTEMNLSGKPCIVYLEKHPDKDNLKYVELDRAEQRLRLVPKTVTKYMVVDSALTQPTTAMFNSPETAWKEWNRRSTLPDVALSLDQAKLQAIRENGTAYVAKVSWEMY